MNRIHRYSANYIFSGISSPIKNGVVVLDGDGAIVDIIDPGDNIIEHHSTEFHNGIIVPGFVNAHSHLELSHLKGELKKLTGIAGFVSQVRGLRKARPQEIKDSIVRAIKELRSNGTVAVGDICNTSDTLEFKLESDIFFHNFIEQFGLNRENADERFKQSMNLLELFQSSNPDTSSLTPHSTYSISDVLWDLISDTLSDNDHPVSIHYGESNQEYIFLKDKKGPIAESFREHGIPFNLPDFQSPLEIVERYIPKKSKLLLVHNTHISKPEVEQLSRFFKDTYFVLCPTSNLFIEGVLPDVPMIVSTGVNIALGTDSYASSDTISVFDQIMILLEKFPSLNFNQVLSWATINGAKALNFESKVGSFEIGKKPGVILISNFDFSLMRPTLKSRVKRLI